jgi:MMPL family
MDYEVFVVSRIREFWLASGRTPADSDKSVALGVACTGRVVTAAALVMSISFAALIAAQCGVYADVRSRSDTGRGGGRHAGADGLGTRAHASASRVELVGAQAAGAAAGTPGNQRRSRCSELAADARAAPNFEGDNG